jgi:DNA-directed RNA polymerase specialized sigma24 family protein
MSDDTAIGGGGGRFPTTHRSAVLATRSADGVERERAIARLLETYWKPAYKYVRVKWNAGNEDAKDLVQSFFTRSLEKGFFDRWEPERGSFRGYLRLCLDGFVSNERKSASRQKRSPGSPLLSLDFEEAEGELATPSPPKSTSGRSGCEASSPRRSSACGRNAHGAAESCPGDSSSATTSTPIRRGSRPTPSSPRSSRCR